MLDGVFLVQDLASGIGKEGYEGDGFWKSVVYGGSLYLLSG
jgi:hypothetical protein